VDAIIKEDHTIRGVTWDIPLTGTLLSLNARAVGGHSGGKKKVIGAMGSKKLSTKNRGVAKKPPRTAKHV